MTTLTELSGGWHEGERAVHKLLNTPSLSWEKPTSRGMPAQYGYRISASPLVAFGTLDAEGRPWTTVWGGERQFARPIAKGILGVQSLVDRRHDPVLQAFLGLATDGELVRPVQADGKEGKPMSALSVDLENRDRVKVAGRMTAGAVAAQEGGSDAVGEVQMAVQVEETLGNCPKYMNKKVIRAHIPSPELLSDTLPLPKEALGVIEKADMFFMTSANGDAMDTNHRGGPAGFVRVAKNEAGEVVVIYPEYSGNTHYESLGNLYLNPKIGIAIPDFDTSDVLYFTGNAEIIAGRDAAALLPHTKLIIKITVTAARFVTDGLPFRGTPAAMSPYNPPVRQLASELAAAGTAPTDSKDKAAVTATLHKRETITPTINRYTFRLDTVRHKQRPKAWKAGQYITLDFSPELDHGWSHMRPDDPQSLNDDFVRTFTISKAPSGEEGEDGLIKDGTEVEITARTHGPATKLLAKYNLRAGPLEIPVVGFGGEEGFRIPVLASEQTKIPAFVAGGVGITPLLAQAPGLLIGDDAKLRVLWTLRGQDLPLAVEALGQIAGLDRVLRVFVTGEIGAKEEELISQIEKDGATVMLRRLVKEDVLEEAVQSKGQKYYLCVSPEFQKILTGWLEGEEVVSESFNY